MSTRPSRIRSVEASAGAVELLPGEGTVFVPPENYVVPPVALRKLLDLLVSASNHHTDTAAG